MSRNDANIENTVDRRGPNDGHQQKTWKNCEENRKGVSCVYKLQRAVHPVQECDKVGVNQKHTNSLRQKKLV